MLDETKKHVGGEKKNTGCGSQSTVTTLQRHDCLGHEASTDPPACCGSAKRFHEKVLFLYPLNWKNWG